jgi:uncharacterized protein involved in outer membrane biogenesis
MKKIAVILTIIFICLAGLIIFQNQIIKSTVVNVASRIVGAPVKVKTLSFSLIKSTVNITGFEIGNPDGFPKGILASIPTIKVTVDRPALFKGKIHLITAEIDIRELGLIKNKDGLLNVDALNIVKQSRNDSKNKPPLPMQIDRLTLSIGKIVHKDYAREGEPTVKVHEMNIYKSYQNITSAEQLVALILVEPMKAAGIQMAAIYGVSVLTGVAFLPVAVVFTFIGKDNAAQNVTGSYEHVYAISEAVIKRIGVITQSDSVGGEIRANINGANVLLKLQKQEDNKTRITISARKFMFPQPDVAGGVLYQILEQLSQDD